MSNALNSNIAFVETISGIQYVIYKKSPVGISRLNVYSMYRFDPREKRLHYICEVDCPHVVGRTFSPYLFRTMALVCLAIRQEIVKPSKKDIHLTMYDLQEYFELYKKMYNIVQLDNVYAISP